LEKKLEKAAAQPAQPRDLQSLVNRQRPRLLRLACRLMGNAAEGEEVLQEGLLRAYRSLATFRAEGDFAAWVRSIVINEALHRLRRRRLQRRLEDFIGRFSPLHPFGWQQLQSQPQQEAERNEQRQKLYQLVDQLPERQRVAVSLRYFEDLSVEEIARITGTGPGTVKTHLVRALHKLRKKLKRGHP
jgi:RNA polymerase sigma-70 factor (ECF subfamily)